MKNVSPFPVFHNFFGKNGVRFRFKYLSVWTNFPTNNKLNCNEKNYKRYIQCLVTGYQLTFTRARGVEGAQLFRSRIKFLR